MQQSIVPALPSFSRPCRVSFGVGAPAWWDYLSALSTAAPLLPFAVCCLQPKLLLDSMLGRLCRWLRALGIDAEFVEAGQQGQAQSQGALIQQVQEAALLQVSRRVCVLCVRAARVAGGEACSAAEAQSWATCVVG